MMHIGDQNPILDTASFAYFNEGVYRPLSRPELVRFIPEDIQALWQLQTYNEERVYSKEIMVKVKILDVSKNYVFD